MRRALISLAIVFLAAIPVVAQDGPQVIAELDETETVIGQPLVLRIKVLVPTWLPQPPDFPSFDLPGLLVRLPERASGPISERVGSDTWSGVQRAYRIYPLQPGRFEIPGQSIRITYAKPGGSDPVTEEIALKPIAFNAIVPEAARDLDPLIVATGFTLDAKIEGQEQLAVGDAVVRTLEASISGTTPILIPRLSPDTTGVGLRAYSDEPIVIDKEDRGVLSGARTERTTYLATAEGSAELPAVHFDWYNLETGKVETAEVPLVRISVVPGEAAQGKSQPVAWRKIITGLLAIAFALLVLRTVWHRIGHWVRSMMNRWRASEHYASRQVFNAIRHMDLGNVYSALEIWRRFHPGAPIDNIQSALIQVGRQRHAKSERSSGARGWIELRKCFASARRTEFRAKRHIAFRNKLNPLNPFWSASDGS